MLKWAVCQLKRQCNFGKRAVEKERRRHLYEIDMAERREYNLRAAEQRAKFPPVELWLRESPMPVLPAGIKLTSPVNYLVRCVADMRAGVFITCDRSYSDSPFAEQITAALRAWRFASWSWEPAQQGVEVEFGVIPPARQSMWYGGRNTREDPIHIVAGTTQVPFSR